MIVMKLAGVPTIIRNLKKAVNAQQSAITCGLVEGGRFLQRESQKIVPVDTGALKNSAFTRILSPVDIIVGYTQSYAVYVHENLEARHKPGKLAKYLEMPARVFRKDILNLIWNTVKRKRGI